MDKDLDPTFVEATKSLHSELRAHCYRMLGSSHDSDDMLQETLLRAWRARGELKDGNAMRPWLYRIASNVCIDELRARPKRALATDTGRPAAAPAAPIAPPVDEPVWLEPMPDEWLAGCVAPDPLSRYSLKESVALAFVAALQWLTPEQRATLLLRDVVGMSAAETARALGLSVPATNGALFRARRVIGERSAAYAGVTSSGSDDEFAAAFVRAFEDRDVDALVALLREDVTTTMPPSPTWISGREDHRTFYGQMFAVLHPGAIRLVRLAANGELAFAFYRAAVPGAPRLLRAIEVVTVRSGRVARIDHFMARAVLGLFDVPSELADETPDLVKQAPYDTRGGP